VTDSSVRLRFAPSPTGSIHIGGVRQALFSWLYARKHGGAHILRIEDTDRERYVEEAVDELIEVLDWFGIDFDEGPHAGGDYGPYVQSERLELYQKWGHWLVEQGKAYKAFETQEELDKIADERKKMGLPPGYDGRARNLTDDEIQQYEAEGRPYVIRFKMPRGGSTIAEDLIRGKVEFENDKLTDPVLLKSDGFPTYHLAVIIDDHLMEISHVTRGVEWLPSLPIHWNLWEAFGWERPVYAHMPLILNPDGKGKLSKRHDHAMAREFINKGYLPEATLNFLTNIGWNFGDNQEIFTIEEAMERFDLADVNQANSAYPVEKLDWLNGHYIREELTTDELAERMAPFFEDAGLTVDMERMKQVAPIIQTRIKTLSEAVELAGFFFEDWGEFEAPSADNLIQRKMDAEGTVRCLEAAIDLIESLDDFSHDNQYAEFKKLAKELEVKNGQLFGSVRVAVTGQRISPPTFESMEILGKEESVRRCRLAIEKVQAEG
jgi:glutamyl-tRNA synthetase